MKKTNRKEPFKKKIIVGYILIAAAVNIYFAMGSELNFATIATTVKSGVTDLVEKSVNSVDAVSNKSSLDNQILNVGKLQTWELTYVKRNVEKLNALETELMKNKSSNKQEALNAMHNTMKNFHDNNSVIIPYFAFNDEFVVDFQTFGKFDDIHPKESTWFQEATKKNGQVWISNVYIEESNGHEIITFSKLSKELDGVLSIDVDVHDIIENIRSMDAKEEFRMVIVDNKNRVIYGDGLKVGSALNYPVIIDNKMNTEEINSNISKHGLVFIANLKELGWKVGIATPK